MRVRNVLFVSLVLAGCQSARTPTRSYPPPFLGAQAPADPRITARPPEVLAASASVPAEAVPEPEDALTLAAECLQRGDEPAACVHLEAHVRRHPEQVMFRFRLAELLLRNGKPELARFHLERFAADAQEAGLPLREQLVACHTHLMELARDADDPFAEQFHRGVGLLLVAEQPETDETFREEVLCKAVKALTAARELRPDDARVRLYLAEARSRLGNSKGADAERRAARNAARPGSLTPAEQQRLALAGRE
jgi:predicted Zn-dependent protease